MSERWDLVVVGGGHNGLTAATAVARTGRRVLVVERRSELGGLAAGDEFHPGYRGEGALFETSTVRSWVCDELELGKHGLARRPPPAILVPRRSAPGFVLRPDASGVIELDGAAEKERSAFRAWRAFVDRIAPVIRRWTDRPPPDLLAPGPADLLSLGLTGFALRRLGRGTMSELLRVAPTCVADWLGEWFDDEAVKAALAAPAIWASRTGPRSPGTSANLLLAAATAERPVAGGGAALVSALERAARASGAEIRTGCEVAEIRIAAGRAAGVRLAGGEEIDARRVAASCDPQRVFLRLVAPTARSRGLDRDLTAYRARGSSARVDLALRGYPDFTSCPGERFESIRVGETLDELERAADAVKYRRFSDRPLLEVRVPTIESPELAPPGHHVVSILAHFAPYELEGGWSEERREALGERVVEVLADHAPELESLLVARRTLTPADLEEGYALTGGHLFHGEHALDQLLVRPTPDCARFATPVPGLFLCGSGSHPGGGLTCVPGALAARAMVDSRRRATR